MILGAVEAGGTKMVCAIGDETGKIYEKVVIPTTTPSETIGKIVEFFKKYESTWKIEALGVATFGPVDLRKDSATFGHILTTPKKGWENYPIYQTLSDELKVPVGIDTDVNGSCLGEVYFGSHKGLKSVAYITVGTGIGVGIVSEGKPVHGMLHPEGGHMLIEPIAGDESHCLCPFHKNCLEGLASGPSIEKRYGKKADLLPVDHIAWEQEATYLAKGIVNIIMLLSPERIILGGGVMHQEHLFPMIRRKVKEYLAGYIVTKELENMDQYIIPASCGDDQGILGCFYLAKESLLH